MPAQLRCEVTSTPLQLEDYRLWLEQPTGEAGAVVCFSGLVRDHNLGAGVQQLELEHYPGMTEKQMQKIAGQAGERWQLGRILVIHRVGLMQPGDHIVFVGVTATHRHSAFLACEYIMDFLKTRAPFWKKETGPAGSYWVAARESDQSAANRWLDNDDISN